MDSLEIERLNLLATAGSIDSGFKLADFYLEEKIYDKAFCTLNRMRYFANREVYRKLGYLYQNGFGVEKDIEVAKRFYKNAYDKGDYISGYNLALLCYKEKDFLGAFEYLLSGEKNNHKASIKMLGDLYYKGLGVEKGERQAYELYKKAYKLGEFELAYVLGNIALNQEKYNEAFRFYSSNNLDNRCLVKTAICYLRGEGTDKNYTLAISYLETGIKRKDPNSMRQLAILYRDGIGVQKNMEMASKLLKEASELIKN